MIKGEDMIDDKAFVAFFNELIENIENSCGRRGCSAKDLPTDTLQEEVEDEDVGLPWGY